MDGGRSGNVRRSTTLGTRARRGDVQLLAIDDDLSTRRFLERTLNDFVVDVAGSGEEGLILLAQSEYDVLICDYHLPGMNGLEFLEEAAAIQPHAGCILITANALVRAPDHVAVLIKPLGVDDLRLAVGALGAKSLRSRADESPTSTLPRIPLAKKPDGRSS